VSQSSRAQRRQASRGGPQPPRRRDPMGYVYIAFGAIIVIAVIAFAAVNLEQQHAVAVASATPTPGPNPTSSPITLVPGVAVGVPAFPSPLKMNVNRGLPVDGIICETGEEEMQLALHIHSHLAIFDNGKQLQVPALIGAAPVPPQGCLYWLHTHDATGIIHIESPVLGPPGGGPFTLGMVFDIWGEPLTSTDVAGLHGTVTAYVNGMRWNGDLRSIPLAAHQLITLEIGKQVPPPNYTFPPGT
jgi:hypothetical protein